jgi:hypothetical protein
VGRKLNASDLVIADISTQSSTSFEHANQPNIFVDATEVSLANGGHLVRALSVTQRVSNADGCTTQELMGTVTVPCAMSAEHDMDVDRDSFDDFFNEEDLRFLECNTSNSSGIFFNRSTSSDHGKVYRNVSISKMGPGAATNDFAAAGGYLGQGMTGVMNMNMNAVNTGRESGRPGEGPISTGAAALIGRPAPPVEPSDFENLSMSSWPSRDLQQLSDLMQCRSLESFSRSNSISYGLQPTAMTGTGDIMIGNGLFTAPPSRRSSFTASDYGKLRDALLPVVTDCDDDDDQSMRN